LESEKERERKKREIFKKMNLTDGNDLAAIAEIRNSILAIANHDLDELKRRSDLSAKELGETGRSSEVQLKDRGSVRINGGTNNNGSSLMTEKLLHNDNYNK
jgi:hypothetical protein